MESCGFFDSHYEAGEYDRVYNADQHAQYFSSFIGNGVFKYNPILGVVESSTPGLSVTVTKGQAWINGYWYKNDDELELPISLPDESLSRIDAVAIRWNNITRDIKAVIIQGEPASSPVAPEPQRDAVIYDLIVAHVRVDASALRITNENIIDTRLDFDICGFVYTLVDRGEEASIERQIQLINEKAIFYPVDNSGEKIIPPSNISLVSDGRGGVKWGEEYEDLTLNIQITQAKYVKGQTWYTANPLDATVQVKYNSNGIYANEITMPVIPEVDIISVNNVQYTRDHKIRIFKPDDLKGVNLNLLTCWLITLHYSSGSVPWQINYIIESQDNNEILLAPKWSMGNFDASFYPYEARYYGSYRVFPRMNMILRRG